jgi:tetratricopeptide (TPR) repeat protein
VLGQTIEQCKLLRYLGVFSHREGQFSSALDYYHQALEIMNANREKVNIDTKWALYEAEIPNLMGCAYMDLQDFKASYRELKLSIEKYKVLVQTYPQEREYYRYYKADPLLNLGQWHYLQGDYNEARKYYQECLQLCQEISRPDTMSGVLLRLAELAEVEGNEEEALKLASEAEEVAGTEVTSVREKAARFRDKLLKKKQHIASHI